LGPVLTDSYAIQNLESDKNIYYEKFSTIKVQSGYWRMFSFIDIDNLNHQYNFLSECLVDYKTIIEQAQHHGFSEQKQLIMLLDKKLDDLQQINIFLTNTVKSEERKFSKRGIFDLGGSIMKVVFGTMDAVDEAFIREELSKIDRNEQTLKIHAEKQASIVLELFDNIVDTNTTILEMAQKMESMEKLLNSLAVTTTNTLRKLEVMSAINEIGSKFLVVSDDLQTRQKHILNILIRPETVSAMELLSPKIFLNEIQNIQKELGHEKILPFYPTEENLLAFYRISEVTVAKMDKHLIIQVSIPLVLTKTYEAFKVTPIPIHSNNNLYQIIDTDINFLAKNENNYFEITQSDLEKCLTNSDTTICQQTKPLQKFENDKSCVTSFFKLQNINKGIKCETKIIEIDSQLWIQLVKENTYIFAVNEPTTIQIICNGQENEIFQIKNIGKISFQAHCRLESNKVIVHSQNPKAYTKKIQATIFNLNYQKHGPLEKSLNDQPITKIEKMTFGLFDKQKNSITRKEIEKLQHIELEKLNSTYTKNNFSLWAIIIGALLILTLYCTIKFCCKCNKISICCFSCKNGT
jgi:hypothetical protein